VAHALLAALVAASAAACGAGSTASPSAPTDVVVGAPVAQPPADAPAPPPAPPPQRDALDLAVALVGARAGALVHVESWRDHPSLPRILGAMPFRGALERAGIDLAKDVDRVLVAGPDPRVWGGVAVYEHHIDRARLDRFLVEAAKESSPPGEALRDGAMTGVRVSIRTHGKRAGDERTFTGDVWLATPTLLVAVPPSTTGVARFARSGGLPLQAKGEGVHGWALEPHDLLANRHVSIPETLSRADAWAFPTPGGGVRAELRARSTSPEQAATDAKRVTSGLDRATSVKIGPLTVRVFQTPVFRAEGDEVVGETQLARAQLEQLLVLAQGEMPSY
jgi:hypothetical protein